MAFDLLYQTYLAEVEARLRSSLLAVEKDSLRRAKKSCRGPGGNVANHGVLFVFFGGTPHSEKGLLRKVLQLFSAGGGARSEIWLHFPN